MSDFKRALFEVEQYFNVGKRLPAFRAPAVQTGAQPYGAC